MQLRIQKSRRCRPSGASSAVARAYGRYDAERWAMAPSGTRRVLNDALSIYFADATMASAFVARWWCVGAKVETPVTRWVWKRSHGRTSEAPPDERGGNRYVRPTATAPHSDSTQAVARGSSEGCRGFGYLSIR